MSKTASKEKKGRLLFKIGLGFLVLLFVGWLSFVYAILPEKVAQSIYAKSLVRKTLTDSPKNYGMAYEDVSFKTSDGITLSGWWLPAPSPKKALGTVVLSHGVFKNREQVLERAELLVKSGYQVLLFDHRGCGLSGESPVSGGLLESEDYLAALAMLQESKKLKRPLVFFGFSMGAMSALRAASKGVSVEGVIADSPLANLDCYVSRRTAGGTFSSMPGFLAACLAAYDRKTGLHLTVSDMDLVPAVEKIRDIPVLYITGENDDLARSEEVRRLFEHTPTKRKRLVYVPDAGHEETFDKSPILYRRSVIGFLTDLGAGFPEAMDWPGTKKVTALKSGSKHHSTHPMK